MRRASRFSRARVTTTWSWYTIAPRRAARVGCESAKCPRGRLRVAAIELQFAVHETAPALACASIRTCCHVPFGFVTSRWPMRHWRTFMTTSRYEPPQVHADAGLSSIRSTAPLSTRASCRRRSRARSPSTSRRRRQQRALLLSSGRSARSMPRHIAPHAVAVGGPALQFAGDEKSSEKSTRVPRGASRAAAAGSREALGIGDARGCGHGARRHGQSAPTSKSVRLRARHPTVVGRHRAGVRSASSVRPGSAASYPRVRRDPVPSRRSRTSCGRASSRSPCFPSARCRTRARTYPPSSASRTPSRCDCDTGRTRCLPDHSELVTVSPSYRRGRGSARCAAARCA